MSVTYGAGGTHAAQKTIEIVSRDQARHGLEAMAHFTCVGATVDELRTTLDRMRDAGHRQRARAARRSARGRRCGEWSPPTAGCATRAS